MKPELILDMTEKEYHASSGIGKDKFVTRSMLGLMDKDPPMFKYRYIDNDPFCQIEDSEPMKFGRYVEQYLFGDDLSNWSTRPEKCWSRNKKEWVDWNNGAGRFVSPYCTIPTSVWTAEHPDIIKDEEVQIAEFMKKRFEETALGKFWIEQLPKAQKQAVCRWKDKDTGINCQIRIDAVIPGSLITDLKSSGSPLEKFTTSALAYDYHTQHAMYQDGYAEVVGEVLPFAFAIGEVKGLKRARIRTLPPLMVDHGRLAYKRALKRLEDGDYSPYDANETTPQECELPAYLLYQLEGEQ